MVKVTSKGYYAVKALLELAGNITGEPVPLSQICNKQDIPLNYLEQLFVKLRKAGIVKSFRGPKGGYRLLKDPKKITIREIIKALGVSLAPVVCVENGFDSTECEKIEGCVSRLLWKKIGLHINNLLDSINLAGLIKESKKINKKDILSHNYIFYI